MSIKKIRTVSAAAFFGVLCGVSFAQAVPSVAEQTKEIINVVSKFGSSIGCLDMKPTSKDIFAMVPFKTDDDRFDAKFAVTWDGDIGCNGGSGTMTRNVAIVRIGVAKSFYVDVMESDPVQRLPVGVIERIVGASKDTLIVDSLKHAENDGNNFPSIRERFTLKQSDGGKWKVVEIKKMPPVKY